MAQYKIGTATFTNGSATVTGTGTEWLANLSEGDEIVRKGGSNNTYVAYEIGGVVSDTELTLTAVYGGDTATNVQYVAHIDFQSDGVTPKFSNGDVETASIFNRFGLLYSALRNWVLSHFVKKVDSVADLFGLTGVDGQQVSVGEYHLGTNVGDGNFKWGNGRHNGGTFIDPARTQPTPAEWANGSSDPAVIAWFADSGVDVDGWERNRSEFVNFSYFGAFTTDTNESTLQIESAISYAKSISAMITSQKDANYKTSRSINLVGVAGNLNWANIRPNFTGSEGVILGNDSDIENLDIWPMSAVSNDASLGALAPTDGASHGFKIIGRGTLRNLRVFSVRGNGFQFEIENGNASGWWNLRATGCDKGFYFASDSLDNVSICEGSFYAYGNSGPGFFSEPDSNFRQNKIFIRSEFNNKNGEDVFDGRVIDTFIGGATYSDLLVYSEGTGGVVDNNIYADPASCFRSNIRSVRQDKDTIASQCVSTMGARVWQNDNDGVDPIRVYEIGNSNPSTFPMRIDYKRGNQYYGKILCINGNMYVSNEAEDLLLGISGDGAIVGNNIIIAGSTELTTGSPNSSIKIGDLPINKLMTGKIHIEAISGGLIGRRQFHLSFNAYNGTVTFGSASPDNINSHADSYSTFTVTQTGTEVFIDMSYQSGNLGGLYRVKYQSEYTIIG